MRSLVPTRTITASRDGIASVVRGVPVWATLVFATTLSFVFSPNILSIYGIHNDYEMLYGRTFSLLHAESEHQFAIVRPVTALFTNLPMLAVAALSDYRWTRIFSVLTTIFMGMQLMSICIGRLQIRTLDALAIALATFLVPPFIYSVLNATAWAAHLLPVALAFVAYAILSGGNVQALPVLGLAARRDWRGLALQISEYARTKPVWAAVIALQISLYAHPPNALIIVVFPIVALLFSQSPLAYRMLIAGRDMAFVVANLAVYTVSAKVLYLPVVRLFTSLGTGAVSPDQGPLAARLAATYHFDFNLDVFEALRRLRNVMTVTGDVWFLPQLDFHLALGGAIVLAAGAVAAMGLHPVTQRGIGSAVPPPGEPRSRLLGFALVVGVPFLCFLLATLPVLASATGFITYRTITIPIVIAAIGFLFSMRVLAAALTRVLGARPTVVRGAMDVVVLIVIVAAVSANFQMNWATERLARNELEYFRKIVRQAARNSSTTVVIVDPRSYYLPEDVPKIADQSGRAVPPYELGCLSGYCLQTGAIVHIAAAIMGLGRDRFKVYGNRGGDPVPGLTCAMLTDAKAGYPPNASKKSISIIDWFRTLGPLTCVTYDLGWHDLGG